MPLPNNLKLYQFGNGLNDNYYIFNKVNLSVKGNITLKTDHFDSFSVDGYTKINVGARNKKTGQDLEVDFMLQDTDFFGIGYIQQVFNSKENKLFYYDIDINNQVSFYFVPQCDPMMIPQQQQLPSENLGQEKRMLNVQLKCHPFAYKCKPTLAYFDRNAIVSFLPRYNDGVSLYNAGLLYNQATAIFVVNLGTLTNQQELDLFINPNQSINALVYTDKFFELGDYTIDNTEAVINTTLINNSTNDFLLNNFFNDTTAENRVYMVELSQLAQNETLAITNLDNGSDVLITWRNAVSSPSLMVYNSAKGKMYDSVLKTEINPSFWSVNTTTGNLLYFSPIATKNQTIDIIPEQIRLQKNSSTNLTVKIEALKTYHLN